MEVATYALIFAMLLVATIGVFIFIKDAQPSKRRRYGERDYKYNNVIPFPKKDTEGE